MEGRALKLAQILYSARMDVGPMAPPHVVRRWPWHSTKSVKMRDVRSGQYVAVNDNRWARVNWVSAMSDGTILLMCGLNTKHALALGGDAMFDMPPVAPDEEITVRA